MSKQFWALLVACNWALGVEITAKARDGSIYRAFQNSVQDVAIEKRSADDLRQFWKIVVAEQAVRSLSATSDGGVALLTLSNTSEATLWVWDAGGERKVVSRFALESPQMTMDRSGEFLVAGRGLALLRLGTKGEIKRRIEPLQPGARLVAGIQAGSAGDLYVAGSADSLDMHATPGAYQQESRAGMCVAGFRVPYAYPCYAGWVARLDESTLQMKALSFLGGTQESQIQGLAIAANGEPVVTGWVEFNRLAEDAYPVTAGVAQPSALPTVGSVAMTVSRFNQDLSGLVASTWFTGSDRARGDQIAVEEDGDLSIAGQTKSPDFPRAGGWEFVCGASRSSLDVGWGVGLRMSGDLSAIRAVAHTGEMGAVQRIHFEARTPCAFNAASHEYSRAVSRGQVMTLIGGPFHPEEALRIGGIETKILYRSGSQINFVVPRELPAGESAPLVLGDRLVRVLDIVETRPRWYWRVFENGGFFGPGSKLIDARKADGTLHTEAEAFAAGDEIRVHATGVDLGKPLQLFLDYPEQELTILSARYVEGTGEGTVEIRYRDPRLSRGRTALRLRNGDAETPLNPGYVFIAP